MGAECQDCRDENVGPVPVVVTMCGGALAGTRATPLQDPVCLTGLKPGQTGTIHSTSLDAGDADLLRAMGLRLSARVRLCRLGEPCIVEVLGGGESCARKGGCVCRIGLARPLADKVLVSAIEGG